MNESAVAHFITTRINELDLKLVDIAEVCGFPRPNVITMIKQGKTKLPLDKIGLMARALQVDPFDLFRMCMQEYLPSTWAAIAPILESRTSATAGVQPVSTNEGRVS